MFDFTHRRSTSGYVKLLDDECYYRLELTCSAASDLQGKRIRVCPKQEYEPYEDEETAEVLLHPRQVGVTGEITAARWVKHYDCSTRELINRACTGEMPPYFWRRCFYAEWYSQNGRVVIEIPDPHIQEYVSGAGENEVWQDIPDPEGRPADEDYSDPTDDGLNHNTLVRETVPYAQSYDFARFDGSVSYTEKELLADTAHDVEIFYASLEQEPEKDLDSYDDFIREMDYLEEIIDGKHDDDELLINILPECDYESMTEQQAEGALKAALAVMALHNMTLHLCEHYTSKQVLKILYEDYAQECRIHPGFIGGDTFTHYNIGEQCEACIDAVMADYGELNLERNSFQEPGDDLPS